MKGGVDEEIIKRLLKLWQIIFRLERRCRAEIDKIAPTRNVLKNVFVHIIRKKTATFKYITK